MAVVVAMPEIAHLIALYISSCTCPPSNNNNINSSIANTAPSLVLVGRRRPGNADEDDDASFRCANQVRFIFPFHKTLQLSRRKSVSPRCHLLGWLVPSLTCCLNKLRNYTHYYYSCWRHSSKARPLPSPLSFRFNPCLQSPQDNEERVSHCCIQNGVSIPFLAPSSSAYQ